MVTVRWKIYNLSQILNYIISFSRTSVYVIKSLTYNNCLDQNYAADVCMEPMFWFVDNFTNTIGPIFVVVVAGLTASVVFIAYYIGLPYWWNRNPYVCVFLAIFGNWLLVNVLFHYYMAVVTPPGYPPQGELITEAVSICKKCITPKPPRTHHCSVCNKCILKMDHHCPWLNNCVGFKNHRYFLMYMAYTVAGVLFLILAGYQLVYEELYAAVEGNDEPELEGHPVKFNKTGSIIPVDPLYLDNTHNFHTNEETATSSSWRRGALIYMALINCAVLLALGGLVAWHSRLIGKGETSIEANINKTESERLQKLGKKYVNPYDFGSHRNWRTFLGLAEGRTWLRHILLPSAHEPEGDGLTWNGP